MIDIFNMVDMGGIDVVKAQGEVVDGLFLRLLNSIQNCRYSVLCNWLFAEIPIVPTYVELVFDGEQVSINDLITVTPDDIVHVHSLEIPIEPVLQPLSVAENGEFNPPEGVDGFSSVNVSVPQPPPVIQSLSVAENGTYYAPTSVDGFSPVTVNVQGGSAYFGDRLEPEEFDLNRGGFVAYSTWYASGGSGTETDVYSVVSGKRYLVALGSTVGNRFRSAFFTTNPATATTNLSGTQITALDNPPAYSVAPIMFLAPSNGYIAISKCNNNISGLQTYVFEPTY